MKKSLLISLFAVLIFYTSNSAPVDLTLKSPKAGDTIRVGRTSSISWDILDSQGNRTWNSTFEYKWATSPEGPWNLLAVGKNKKEFKDVNSKNTETAAGSITTVYPRQSVLYIKMQLKDDTSVCKIVGPLTIYMPPQVTPDSIITGTISGTVTLSSNKIYGLHKVVYVANGGLLRIDPGTIIYGDAENVSAICINRGGKIYANGNAQHPIVMTSGYAPGNRDRGDWGGLLIMGSAETNLIEAAIEGGIADDAETKQNAWFGKWNGVNNNEDSSGVIRYVRIEFAGIAESPDNELNSLTMGAVGSKTVIDHIQVSYGGDDSYEWFGGTVNAKYLIAYNSIDDDFDTDNGYSGKVQFGLVHRLPSVADQSNSEAFESDNDSKASENEPFTRPIFSNITAIGAVWDTSWTAGSGTGKYNAKYLTAAQIRRNSRLSLFNSVLAGWPGGIELTNQNTVRAADADSIMVRYNNFYGIKNNKWFYFGSGTTAQGNVDANWLASEEYGNVFTNGPGNVATLAGLQNTLPFSTTAFNPLPKAEAAYITTARWDVAPIQDDYFDKVNYRGAFSPNVSERWDMPWADYDPINTVHSATSVNDELQTELINITISPLPATDFVNVVYNLYNSNNVTIKMFDSFGNEISTFLNNVNQNEAYYQFSIDLRDLSSGIYFLQFMTPSEIKTEKISVVK